MAHLCERISNTATVCDVFGAYESCLVAGCLMNWARQDARECTMHNKSETNNDSKHWKRTLRECLLFTSVELSAWSARVRNRRRQHRPHRPSVEPSLFSSPRALHNSILNFKLLLSIRAFSSLAVAATPSSRLCFLMVSDMAWSSYWPSMA